MLIALGNAYLHLSFQDEICGVLLDAASLRDIARYDHDLVVGKFSLVCGETRVECFDDDDDDVGFALGDVYLRLPFHAEDGFALR